MIYYNFKLYKKKYPFKIVCTKSFSSKFKKPK